MTFLGTGSVVPEGGRETSSLLIADRLLVDAGWCNALAMLPHGVSPADLDALLLTHCHHDHYLGLPHLLFYRRMIERNTGRELPPLPIVGPAGEIERIVELARRFLQVERHAKGYRAPKIIPLEPGQGCELAGFRVTTCETRHSVPGLAYRIEEPDTGISVVVSGDTAYHPPLAEFARNAALLVHEAACADEEPDPAAGGGHSGGAQAARIARSAAAGQLALTHGYLKDIEPTLAAARRIFPQSVFPQDGETLVVRRDESHAG